MGKSISSLNFAGATGNSLVLTGAWIPGASAASKGTITVQKETGPRRYIVTDGTNTGEVTLVETASVTEGQGYIQIGTSNVFVRQIYEKVVTTSENSFMSWSLNSDKSDIFLPYSVKGAVQAAKTATINSSSPDQLKENVDRTISYDYENVSPNGSDAEYVTEVEETIPSEAGLVLSVTGTTVTATVSAPSDTGNSAIKRYEIYAGSSNNVLSHVHTLNAAGSYNITGLKAGSTEYVRVNVANDVGTKEGTIKSISIPA